MEMEKRVDTAVGPVLLRPYTEADREKVVALWQLVFQKPLSLDHWNWKYHDSPYENRAMLCLNDKDDIVVFFGGIPFSANLKGKSREIIQLMDIMSHPDYRGSHVFGLTAEHFFHCFCSPAGAEMLYGFPGQYHFDIGVKYLGYVGLEQKVGYLAFDLTSGGGRYSEYGASPPDLPKESADSPVKQKELKGRLRHVGRPDFRVSWLWKRLAHHFPFSTRRDAEFVQWRFCKHPLYTYDIWSFKMGFFSLIDAYAVIKRDVAGKRAILVDILCPPSETVVHSFFTHLIGHYSKKEEGIVEINTWLPRHHFLFSSLNQLGFQEKNEPLGIISTVRPFDHSPPIDWISTHLYYTMADGDLF